MCNEGDDDDDMTGRQQRASPDVGYVGLVAEDLHEL